MKGIKKFLILIISVIALLCFTGCGGVYTPPGGSSGGGTGGGSTVQPENPENPGGGSASEEQDYYTVRMVCDEVTYVPYPAKVTAKWTDEFSNGVYTADFDSSGIAKIAGLAGKYRVTLSGLPEGYTYDPNIYSADPKNKDVVITVFRLSMYTGTGADKYQNIITFKHTGIYRATFMSAGQTIFFQYEPTDDGVYSFTSMLDITADEVNPILDVYWGTRSWKPDVPTQTIDDGGECGIYTKNFKWTISHAIENKGAVYAFGVRATSVKASAFPITVDFILEWNDEFTNPVNNYEMIQPKEINGTVAEQPAGTWNSLAKLSADGRRLDGNKVKFKDGYYRLYNAADDTYGEPVYAKITAETLQDTENSFTNPLVNLRLVVRDPDGKKDEQGNVIYYYKNYTDFIRGANGYSKYVNADGVYPVTEELKVFLQEFAISQSYFQDGNGMAEDYYDASESEMWLFAVGYYG